MKKHKIAIIPGDTIGPELCRQAEKVLTALSDRFEMVQVNACGPAIERFGSPFPEEEIRKLRDCRAVIIGNVGASRYTALPPQKKPEAALLAARRIMKVCTNLRPVFLRSGMENFSPLKPEFLKDGLDVAVVRDIRGGVLAGSAERHYDELEGAASDLEYYDEETVRISADMAFRLAESRRKKVCSLDKANVLSSSVLWRKLAEETGLNYPGVSLRHEYVDSAAMNVIRNAGSYDVLLTNNVFGDIISDELTELAGTPAIFGSAEISPDGRGIYTPNQLHTAAEHLTGKNQASPEGILNAVSMMLRWSLQEHQCADFLDRSLWEMFRRRITTPEVPVPGFRQVGTEEYGSMTAELCRELRLVPGISEM